MRKSQESLIEGCRLPELGEPYAAALHNAVAFVLMYTQPVGIVASGTIVRGNPDHSSDIDLYVIHNQPWRQRVQRFFNGVPVEIFINPPAVIERYFAEEQADGRPMTAHMLATGFVVAATDSRVDQLVERAKTLLATPPRFDDFRMTMARYGAASLFEDALDVAERDRATASMLLSKAVMAALGYAFLARSQFLPRNKDMLNAVAAVDAELGAAAHRFFGSAHWEARLESARMIADRAIGARGFFEWESERQDL